MCAARLALWKINRVDNAITKLCASHATKILKWMCSKKPELVYITWNIVIYQDNVLASCGYWISNTLPQTLCRVLYMLSTMLLYCDHFDEIQLNRSNKWLYPRKWVPKIKHQRIDEQKPSNYAREKGRQSKIVHRSLCWILFFLWH